MTKKNIQLIISLFAIFIVILFVGNLEYKKIEEIKYKGGTLKTDYAKLTIQWDPPNNAPSFSAGPSDGGSCTTSPSNTGDTITFSATGTDGDGDDYYLLVCESDSYSTTTSGAPSCNATSVCISSLTSSTIGTSCSTTSADYLKNAYWVNDPVFTWYAYVCDYSATDQRCSSGSQGTGDSGSPVNINNPPQDFDSVSDDGPANPNSAISFSANVYDSDSEGDTVSFIVCGTQSATINGCTGYQYCTSTDSGTWQTCNGTTSLPASAGSTNYYVYTFDEHGLGASNNGGSYSFTINNVAPVLSSVSLNSGSSIDLSSGGEGLSGNKDIIASASVTDNNGCDDISSVIAHTYTTDIGPTGCDSEGEADDNDCYYNVSCSTSSACTSEITYNYECSVNFKYHADPTDANTPKADYGWETKIIASDGLLSDNGTSSAVDLISYLSLDVSSAIEYGSLGIGEMGNSDNLVTTTDVSATGNCGIDVELSGTNMTGSGTITVGQQKYATSSVLYSSAIALSTSATELELNVEKPTTTSASPLQKIYWGLQIPDGTQSGSYSGTNTFTAKKAETSDW